jgi:hypothetical protein
MGIFCLELSYFDLRLGVFFLGCRRFRLYRRVGCKDGSFSVSIVIPGALGGRGDLASDPDIGTYLQKFLTFVSLLGLQFLISTGCTHYLV